MFDFQPHLTGELVRSRPVRPSDWDALFSIGSDPKVWEQHPQRDRYTEANFRIYFDDGLASGGALVAIDLIDGAVVGWSRYSQKFVEPDEVEIGWTFLGRSYWGGDYNRDMKRLMLNHAFRFVPRVIFRIGESNLRSRRAVEKIGATLTDRTHEVTIDGKPSKYLYYAISRSEFEKAS